MKTFRKRRQPAKRVQRLPNQSAFPIARYPSYFADQPPIKYAKLQYTDFTAAADLAIGTLGIKQWRANDLYDPDVAVGGHQPFGFDQLMAMYQHFTVERSQIDVEIMNTGEYKNAGWFIHLAAATGEIAAAYAAGGYPAIVEQPRSTKIAMCAVDVALAKQRTISLQFNAPTFFNKTMQSMIGATSYSGSNTASPVEDAVFEVTCFSPSGLAVDFALTTIKTTITYYAAFSEPKYLQPS